MSTSGKAVVAGSAGRSAGETIGRRDSAAPSGWRAALTARASARATSRRILELARCARRQRHLDDPRFMRPPIRVAIGREHDTQPSLGYLRQDACRGRPHCFGRFAGGLGRRFIDHRGRRAIAFRRTAREAPLDVAAEHCAAAGGNNEGGERRKARRREGKSVRAAHHWPPLFGVRPRKRRISFAGR